MADLGEALAPGLAATAARFAALFVGPDSVAAQCSAAGGGGGDTGAGAAALPAAEIARASEVRTLGHANTVARRCPGSESSLPCRWRREWQKKKGGEGGY